MRRCKVVPLQNIDCPGYKWQWRDVNGGNQSDRLFVAFHDCLEDARSEGFAVILDKPIGDSAPDRYALNYNRGAV